MVLYTGVMNNSITMMEDIIERAHGMQKRQDGTTNATHVRRVRTILLHVLTVTGELTEENRISFNCAALGHDLLEDTEVSNDEVRSIAGEQALAWITELTNAEGDYKTEHYVAQMQVASEEARLVKYADLTDNILHGSYSSATLGRTWLEGFFLPIVDPMRQMLDTTQFVRYPKTAAQLRFHAAMARSHLEESMRAIP